MKIAIVGAGGFGRELYWQMKDNDPYADIQMYADDKYANGTTVFPISQIMPRSQTVFIAIGDPNEREKMMLRMHRDVKYGRFIHKSVQIHDRSTFKMGEGSIICAGAIITTNVHIGKHCHINLGTTIGHDARLGNFVTTAPQVAISGNVNIDSNVYIGTHASIKEKIYIAPSNTIGMHAAVTKDINEVNGTYVGVPARKKR